LKNASKSLLSLILMICFMFTLVPVTALAAPSTIDANTLAPDYVDNSNDAMLELADSWASKISVRSAITNAYTKMDTSTASPKVDLVFVIDSTGSMTGAISNVKANITQFAKYLEDQGINLRIGVVEYRDITVDSEASTIVHKINYSTWHNSTSQLITTLTNISVLGGGDWEETPIDALGYLVNDSTMLWSSDAYKFAVLLTDAPAKTNNRHGYGDMSEMTTALKAKSINTSIITDISNSTCYNSYSGLASETGGIMADIYSYDFYSELQDLADNILGVTKTKKAIYVLPGYMGSKLYDSEDDEVWVDPGRLYDDVLANSLPGGDSSILALDKDGSGSQVQPDLTQDKYGAQDAYKILMDRLEDEFSDEYDVIFFPYNWLGDVNRSARELENSINDNGYDSVILITHSTGGLVASTYIASSRENKLEVEKAILIAPPLYGTYSSLEPIETGKTSDMDDMLKNNGIENDWWFGIKYNQVYKWVKTVTKNSPTTYQLLPSVEYLKLMPQMYKNEFSSGSAVTTASKYYEILNGSSNINSNLTNGNNRSHKYLRETVFDKNVIDVLSEVDTILIGSDYNENLSTPAIACYQNKLFGGTKLTDLIRKKNGDGTVLKVSAFATPALDKHILPYKNFYNVSHGALVTDTDVWNYVSSLINTPKAAPLFSTFSAMKASSGDGAGMSDLVKYNLESDVSFDIRVFDSEGNLAASVIDSTPSGFDGDENSFSYTVFDDSDDGLTAMMYLPNAGYTVEFYYGTDSGNELTFSTDVSTLDYDGFKTATATYTADTTGEDGLILSCNMIDPVDPSNIGDLVDGETITPTVHYTDWNIEDEITLNLDDVYTIGVLGTDADEVASNLNWSTSDEDVLTVSESGEITAVGYGTATIAATDGNKVVTSRVTVTLQAESVSFDDLDMVVGERVLISPIFDDDSVTETDIDYTLSEDGIVEINEYGVIHALAAGEVTVTGTAPGGATNNFTVTVLNASGNSTEAVRSVEIVPATADIRVGKQTTLSAIITPANAANTNVQWYIDDAAIATIAPEGNTCDVTGLAIGSTTVTAVTEDGGYTASCIINVTNARRSDNISNADITYTITATATDGGSITPTSATLSKGSSKTFTITAQDGYLISDVLVDGKSVGAVSSYTFSDVTKAHTIKAVFNTWANPFTDVSASDWFYQYVAYVNQNSLMNGTSNTTFEPNSKLTRAMLVTILYQLESNPYVLNTSSFGDVAGGTWYSGPVAWAAANGIISGYTNGNFGPNDSITREQMASILYRYAIYKGYDVSAAAELTNFTDADSTSSWALASVRWAVGAGLISGKGNGILDPGGTATRAEIASILKQFIENIATN